MAAPFHATLRIDAEAGPRHFQGVWLEHAGERWIVDYRARELWRSFDQLEVIVTGHPYEPVGEAIGAVHFAIETLRAVQPRGRFVAIGPERALTGLVVREPWPHGSKRAGSDRELFATGDGARFEIAGGDDAWADATTVIARVVEPTPGYTATTAGPHLWIVSTGP